jgi:hypothetical protein
MVFASMPDEPRANPPREQAIPRLALAVIVLACPTLFFNRAILPALPGSRSGIEQLFDRLSLAGGILSQLLAVCLAFLLVQLVARSLSDFAIGVAGRLIALPIGSAVCFLLVASTIGPLDPEMHLLLAGLATGALFSSLRPTLRQPTLRAAGILLVPSALASLAYSVGRLLAFKASSEALPHEYAKAQYLTTLGLLFDVLALLWVAIWLVMAKKDDDEAASGSGVTERLTTTVRVAIALTLAITCALLAHRGQASTANFVEVVLSRSMTALAREPMPFGLVTLGPSLDVFAVLLALILLTRPTHVDTTCRWAMALVLLGRCAPDIPAHGALMTAGALLLLWYAPSALTPVAESPAPPEEESK